MNCGQYLVFARIFHPPHMTYHIRCEHITLANRDADVSFSG
jgi:hypothetical protein